MDLILIASIWGGIFYLLNKLLFAVSEFLTDGRLRYRLLRVGWLVWIIGAAAWIFVYWVNGNFVAASLEAGVVPLMIVGFFSVSKSGKKLRLNPIWERSLVVFVAVMIQVGMVYSLYAFGGVKNITQVLEFAVVSAYIMGTYRLARGQKSGYIFIAVMNIGNAALLWLQGVPILAWQQILSLVFVVIAYRGIAVNERSRVDSLNNRHALLQTKAVEGLPPPLSMDQKG